MALIAVDPAFSLLKVNWIRREIPVDDRVAVVMEVEAFLADGCSREGEGPERRVESFAYLTCVSNNLAIV